MISDFIKGKKQYELPLRIQAGIQLHRAIDSFTDKHASTREIANYLKPAYRLYAGAFVDIIYDYFIANDIRLFPQPIDLYAFTQHTYELLDTQAQYFGSSFSVMYPYMKSQNWLYHYREAEGIRKSFGGLMRRSRYITETDTAFFIFQKEEQLFKNCYDLFIPDAINFVSQYLSLHEINIK